MKLWIVNEENHPALVAATDVYLAVKWLLENDWLLPVTECTVEDGSSLPMWRFIGLTRRRNCTKQDIYLFFASKTSNEVVEILEKFDFYLSRIDYVES